MSENQDKNENSYTYWVKKDDNFFKGISVDIKPKKIEVIQEEQRQGYSAWNNSGTWEEKKINLDDLKLFLNTQIVEFFQQFSIISNGLQELSGEANVVFINKKIKPGYNLKLDILLGEKDEGVLKIKNFEDDGSFELQIQLEEAELKNLILSKQNDFIQFIQSKILEFTKQL